MLRTDLTDHRGTDDARLVHAVADGDAIALAEAYHRTITAAHACARRLLASPVEIEALLRAVYSELWDEPPVDEALEGWVRARCFNLGTGYLRQRNLRAPSGSLAAWTSGIEADEQHSSNDTLERMIAELTDQQQKSLVLAHDQGIRTAEQDDPQAGVALQHALLVLASPLTDDERHAAEMCSSGVALANWIFGLLPPHEAATVPGTSAEPTPCGRLAGVLRRARRRFEPLPPTPDLGHRVLASVLGSGTRRESAQTRASRLDSDLRIASADLDRRPADGAPRSSLDMSVPAPAPAEAQPQPVTALRRENGSTPRGWDTDEPGQATPDQPTPLRAPSGPPALAGSGAAPVAFGNAAPALAPAIPEPEDDTGEDLVRMPLHRQGRPPVAPAPGGDRAPQRRQRSRPSDDTETIRSPAGQRDDDETQPPVALRARPDDETGRPVELRPRPDDETLPPATRAPRRQPLGGTDDDDGPALSPFSAEERRGSLAERDLDAESPLRRPALSSGSSTGTAPRRRDLAPDLDTQPHSLLPPGPRRERTDQPGRTSPLDADADAATPIQPDDSDPRLDDLFGNPPDAGGAPGAQTSANMTAPTLPAARRPTPPPNRPAASAPQGPPVSNVEPDAGGSSVLRWFVVLLLIAAGAAVGIFLGQMLI